MYPGKIFSQKITAISIKKTFVIKTLSCNNNSVVIFAGVFNFAKIKKVRSQSRAP